jgi:hypothetical protein
MTKLGTPREETQQPLSPALHYQKQGSRLRALLNRTIAANRLDVVDLEADTGVDEKQIGRALKDDGGAHPPLSVVACILAKDRAGVFIAGLAEMLGYEARPKSPDLAGENRMLREKLAAIQGEIAGLLGGAP